jgi:hypothetical protein
MSAGSMTTDRARDDRAMVARQDTILALSHALITLAATTRLICIDTRHPMPKENLGVAAEALRKAGYSEAAEQVGK